MGRLESAYVANHLIPQLEARYPGCLIIKPDPQRRQGVLDLLILFGPYWAMLEAKRSANSPYRPNQPYYVDFFNEMSFAAFIYPENEEDVLHGLDRAFGVRR